MRPPYIAPTLPKTPFKIRQISMDPVEVYCRIRPLNNATPIQRSLDGNTPASTETCIKALDSRTVQLTPPSGINSAGNIVKASQCTFTYVFDELASQKDAFDRVAFDLVVDLIQGKNGLLFTYGVTGSGKTYTMTGNPNEIGILPRTLDTLFNSIQKYQAPKCVFKVDTRTNTFSVQREVEALFERQRENLRPPFASKVASKPPATPGAVAIDWQLRTRVVAADYVRSVDEDNAYAVFVSYVQIYNGYVYDLLDPDMPVEQDKLPPSKLLREDADRNMFIGGVTEIEVKNTEEAFDVFMQGQNRRRTAHTLLNSQSSRSHSVFNIRLLQAPLDANGKEVIQDRRKIHVSQLALVDLAGSERSNRTGHVGERMREAGNINESLMTLRQCMEQLRENQKTGGNKLVPYRNSRLTHLFKNYFDGEGKVRMIVCVNPSAADYDENKHVMDFAELSQEVEVPRSAGLGFAEDPDGLALTPGRRRAAALYDEVRERIERDLASVGESASGVNLPKPPTFSLFFEPMPTINVGGITANDNGWIIQLRNHFEIQYKRRRELLAEAAQKSTEFESALRKFVVDHEALKLRHQQESREFAEREKENHRLQVELRTLQAQNATLEAKLSKYERDAKYMQNQEDQLKRREREMAAQVRQKDEKLRQVKEIFERTPMSPIQAIQPRRMQDNTPGSSAATGASGRMGAGVVNRTALYPQLPVFTAMQPLRAPASAGIERRRAASPPAKYSSRVPSTPMGTRTLNRVNQAQSRGRNHRRSKSVDADIQAARGLSTLHSTDGSNENSSGQKRKSDEVEEEGDDQMPGTSGVGGQAVQGILKKSKY